MDKANRKVTFEEEADLYEKEALAEIKKQHFDGTEEMGEPYSTLQMGRRVVYRARQEIANRVEVLHARWENIRNFGGGECYGWCSHCKTPVKADNATGLKQNNRFCHWCGAKMDGGNEDG